MSGWLMAGQKLDHKKEKEGQWRWCACCGEMLQADHAGIHCMNSHHLCGDCSANAKASILGDVAETDLDTFPPKCGFCASQLNLASFERQLTEEERAIYLTMMMLKELPEGELVQSCPFCPFFCTRVVADVTQAPFIHCQRPGCFRVSCAICRKGCEAASDEGDDMQDMIQHFECAEKEAEYGKVRDALQQAIEEGIKPRCPSCKHAGTKDDACTHMTCESCHTVWCYVCGLDTASVACDKGHGEGGAEYRHNESWHSLTSRCPMYLAEIHQVDGSWPADDEEAKEVLHVKLALRNLRRVLDNVGLEKYRKTVAAFPSVGPASGFTEEQIQAVDLHMPLFQRASAEESDYDDCED